MAMKNFSQTFNELQEAVQNIKCIWGCNRCVFAVIENQLIIDCSHSCGGWRPSFGELHCRNIIIKKQEPEKEGGI
jgi:hypothetical protein